MVYNLIKLYGENSLQSSYADTVGITTFNSTEQQGFITYLPDATSATVTEEINGQFDLVMSYPVTGDGYKDILVNRIIACKPNPHSSVQAFRIYKISKPIDGIVDVTANHISYDLNGYILNPFTVTNKTPDEVIKAFKSHSTTACPFSFSSDVNKTVSKFAVSKPISIREILGGQLSNELSLIQTCSGEFEFDNLKVSLKQARGSDNGVRISYGKNLTEFKYDEDSSSFYTGVYPYWSTTKKPDNDSSSTVVTPTVSNQQTFEATAQYGNMNLVLSVTKGSTSGSNTSLSWSLYFKIVVAGGYHFNYQNSCEVYINGAKVFSSANVKAIDINGLVVGATVQLASGTATVPSSKVSVPVSATFIQRQDTRGTWKISGNYAMTGGTEVVTNVATNDIYYTVTLDGTKTHDYDTSVKFKKLYTLDLSKEIEQAKDPNTKEYIYPGVTPAQLNTAFQKYLSENDPPTINTDSLEVSFVDLAQSDEYADYAGLETVNIGDIVTVDFPAYNISKSKECVKTEYDVLSDSYITLTLGELTDTLASTIQNGTSLAQRNTVNAEQLANSVNANFNSIQVLNLTASTIQADYVVVNERLTATEASIGSLTADYGSFKTLTASNFSAVNASIGSLSAAFGSFQTLTASNFSAVNATISSLNADYGSFKSLTVSNFTAVNASIDSIIANYASISYLEANYITASSIAAKYASIDYLTANYASIDYLTANYASIDYLSANYATISNLSAATASIDSLYAYYVSVSGRLDATIISVGSLSAYKADITFANVDFASIDSAFISALDAKYANVDFLNVGVANINSLFARAGIFSSVVIQDGVWVSGDLTAVTIQGDLIKAGTLVADRIVFLGEDGLFYELNSNGVTVSEDQDQYNSLNGSVITAKTVTAEQIYVQDLYALEATIGGLVIESGSIHTYQKTSVTNTTNGIFISPTSMALGNGTEYLRFNADGQNTLEISGIIKATGGEIAGWEIGSSSLVKMTKVTAGTPSTQYRVRLYAPGNASGSTTAFLAGERSYNGMNPDDASSYGSWSDNFYVRYDGSTFANNITLGANISGLAPVATGGSLSASNVTGLSTVATSGSYNDLSNKPTIPSLQGYIYVDGTIGSTPAEGATGFVVSSQGLLQAANAVIFGTIYASEGKIGGWTIGNNNIQKYNTTSPAVGETQYRADLFAPATVDPANNRAISVSSRTRTSSSAGTWSYDFAVYYDGSVVAKKGTIGGWTLGSTVLYGTNGDSDPTEGYVQYTATQQAGSSITSGMYAYAVRQRTYTNGAWGSWDYQFQVKYSGALTAKNATVTGTITAKDGYIGGTGGWVITTGKIYKGTAGSSKGIFLDATAGTTATVAGASHANLMIGVGANFGVDKDGCLFGTNVSISGSITATSGTFTGTVNASAGSFLCSSTGSQIYINSGAIVIRNASGTKVGEISHNSNSFNIVGVTGYNLNIGYGVSTAINIGYGASSINLGNSATGDVYSVAIYEATASTSGSYIRVDSNGLLHRYSSSSRYKSNVSVIPADDKIFDGLLDIRPKYYTYKKLSESDQRYGELMPGLIAEDVLEHYPIACQKNQEGQPDDFDDRMVLVGTLSLLQRLYKRVDELERKIASYDK